MTWAPAHAVKCSLYTTINQGTLQHNPQCIAAAVKCKQGSNDPSKCAAFGSGPGQPGTEGGSHNHPMFGGGVDPWLYHYVGGLQPPSTYTVGPPRLMLGVKCEVMERVHGATAETRIHGHRARSSWRWSENTLEYSATVPVGFRGSLTIPKRCDGRIAGLFEGEGDEEALLWSADKTETPAQVGGVGLIQDNADGDLVVELLSGVFHFSSTFAKNTRTGDNSAKD